MTRFFRPKDPSPTALPGRHALLLTAFAATLASTAPLTAQGVSTAGLRGRVLDQEGVPLEGALVTLEHTETGATNTAITTADGRYTLRSLRPGGPYTLTVTRIGFGEQTREELELLLGRFINLDIVLLPEAVEIEGIEVEVRQDIEFDPGRIGISTLVTAEIIEELPTLTRNFVDFAALSPLARVSEEGVSVAGANYRFNTLNVDGALNQDVFGLSTDNVAGGRAGGRVIPLDAVEQFQVLVAPFDVRQSGFTGGALNAVTRSGTNEFETSAFGYYRSDALVGELVIDDVATVPELSTAHGGFTMGGPIRRDRAHFFVAGEWERVREPPSGFHLGESDEFRLSLVPDSVARMRSLLEGLGADPGTAESFTLQNTIFNLFARFDWEMGERHDAMLRYSFGSADDEPDPNRLPGDLYEFSSSGSQIRSRSHSGFELRKDFGETLGLRAGYSLTRSADIQNLTSIDVTSNYASTPVNLHPNRPIRQRSRFDRPHKVVASTHARIPARFGGTEISVLYVGQSGVPYSYVYKGDVNGDGFPGPRASSLSNDLLFVPDLGSRLPGGGFGNLAMWTGLHELENCLQEQANRILARNTCNAPWSNQIDLRIGQAVNAGGVSAQLTLDLLNILNLLDSSQGIVYVVNPVVQAFEVRRVLLDPLPDSPDPPTELTAHYIGATQRDRETGRLRAALPYVPEVPTSQWRAQFGARLRLGR